MTPQKTLNTAKTQRNHRQENLCAFADPLRFSGVNWLFQKSPERKNINRIIDANINRLKEGLRVCEEIARFIIESPTLTSNFKRIRHGIDRVIKNLRGNATLKLIQERDSLTDAGRNIHIKELNRNSYQDIFFANIQRAKESARVLEEFSKLLNKNTSLRFKKIRYDIYEIEKKTAKRISSLCHYR